MIPKLIEALADLGDELMCIGKEVIVYDRYLFAVPVKGRITDVAEKDGAYQVLFYSDNPGGASVDKHSGKYFHHQQCKLTGNDDVIFKLGEVLTRLEESTAKELDAFKILLNIMKGFSKGVKQ